MAIFDILKKELFVEQDEGLDEPMDEPTEEEPVDEEPVEEPTETEGDDSIKGDPKALVDGMIANAPGSKKQIGVILKYAANSIPTYDIWDTALDYFESIEDSDDDDDDASDDVPVDEPAEEPVDEPTEEPTDEEPAKKSKPVPVTDDNLAM